MKNFTRLRIQLYIEPAGFYTWCFIHIEQVMCWSMCEYLQRKWIIIIIIITIIIIIIIIKKIFKKIQKITSFKEEKPQEIL